MYTIAQIKNLGLAKLSASRVVNDPPRTPLEIHCNEGYNAWKTQELTKRRWVFALEDDVALTQEAVISGAEQPYKYAIPTDCLRPIRQRYTEWKQRGRYIYSADNLLKIQYIKNKAESEFDPLFVDVLAWRVAIECVEMVTQSSSKKAECAQGYKDARAIAGQMNAFIIGPEDIAVDDDDFPFVNARYV